MTALLASTDNSAKDCLRAQLGAIAGRNSCQGPWLQSAVLSLSINPVKFHLPQRATVSLNVSNPLGAADLLLHGNDGIRGWGQARTPDATLLYVRGFDQGTQRFRYDVNQRFGNTDPQLSAIRAPVAVTLQFRFDRFLDAGTANRQALRVYSGDPETSGGYPFDVTYDPVEREHHLVGRWAELGTHHSSGYTLVDQLLRGLVHLVAEILLKLPDRLERRLHQHQCGVRVHALRDELVIGLRGRRSEAGKHLLVEDAAVVQALERAVHACDPHLILVAQAGSPAIQSWRRAGLAVAREAFADRAYEPDGSLRARTLAGAVIDDPPAAAEQALRLVFDRSVITSDHSKLTIECDTICIHSDTPRALDIARAVRSALERRGILLRAMFFGA